MIIDPKELLLEDRFAPVTTSMGLFEAECPVVVHHFLKWQEELKRTGDFIKRISSRVKTGRLEQVLLSLLPLKKIEATRYLFVPVMNGWTAFFDNGYRGTDPTVIAYLPDLIRSRSVWIVASLQKPLVPTLDSGTLVWEVYGHEKMEWLNLIRRVRLENDYGKWHFEQFGNPFPFEQTERYQLKRIPDRFDLPLLKQYLDSLGGLSPFKEDFYLPADHPEAILVETSIKRVEGDNDITFEEAKRLNGIG